MKFKLVSGGTIEISDAVFAKEFNSTLVQQVVQTYLSNGHQGTKAQRSRSDVRGGGRKPWRQKNMGRARAGTKNSPIWRGGGVTFAAKPTVRWRKVNRKMYRSAMCCILSQLMREERISILPEFDVYTPKTQNLRQSLDQLKLAKPLLILSNPSENLQKAVANLAGVEILSPQRVNPAVCMQFDKVVFDTEAIRTLETSLA
ncbi:MAG: 50S ribosomal protein L4 [Gammaproteobacteria bacterium]|nr:50S ribosomal protein L4 [Gammaproteobacteria bacterium]